MPHERRKILPRPGGIYRAVSALVLLVAGSLGPAHSQSTLPLANVPLSMGQDTSVPRSPLLTIDRDALFAGSAYGQRLQADIRDASVALSEENQTITNDLEAEELALTEQRATLPAEEFRALADAFDEKVTRLRSRQDAKTRVLQRRQELERQRFFSAALPILAEIVQEAGAVAILDRGSVFLTADEIDITEVAIRRLDEAIGAGPDRSVAPPDTAPRPRPSTGSEAVQGNEAPNDE